MRNGDSRKDEIPLAHEVAGGLLKRGLSVAVAESCTGGLVGYRLTEQPGSSRYFRGGVVAYADDVKERWLGVHADVLSAEGAVSSAVAGEMAEGVRVRMGADLGLAVTGIAGPGGGTEDKPVGRVYIALADRDQCMLQRCGFEGDRAAIRRQSAETALRMLERYLKHEGVEHGQKE